MKSVLQLHEITEWSSCFMKSLNQKKTATVITLSGDLGAGKTTLTQTIGRVLGVTETITSPTFVIQKEYEVTDHNWINKLIHIDAYRLEQKEDLEYLGWNELVIEPETLIIMEWPEVVSGISFPKDVIQLNLSINDDHSRTIEIKK